MSLNPFSLEECSVGVGAACGSVYLDQGFERLVRNRLGRRAYSILTSKCIAGSLRYFESIKRDFNPYDADCETEFDIPLRGALNFPEIGLEDGYLRLSKYALP